MTDRYRQALTDLIAAANTAADWYRHDGDTNTPRYAQVMNDLAHAAQIWAQVCAEKVAP